MAELTKHVEMCGRFTILKPIRVHVYNIILNVYIIENQKEILRKKHMCLLIMSCLARTTL